MMKWSQCLTLLFYSLTARAIYWFRSFWAQERNHQSDLRWHVSNWDSWKGCTSQTMKSVMFTFPLFLIPLFLDCLYSFKIMLSIWVLQCKWFLCHLSEMQIMTLFFLRWASFFTFYFIALMLNFLINIINLLILVLSTACFWNSSCRF